MEHRLAILYAPAEGPVSQVVEKLENCFDPGRFTVKSYSAAHSDISALNAADLVVLVDTPGSDGVVHPDYTEFVRAFAGVNFAGRVVGLVRLGAKGTASGFLAALRDSSVRIFDTVLQIEVPANPQRLGGISGWARGLAADFQHLVTARNNISPPIH